jgi:hypothetical protein
MTQAQMTVYLAGKFGITKRQAKSTLDELNELVIRQLKERRFADALHSRRATEATPTNDREARVA